MRQFHPLDLAFDKLLAAINTRPAQDILGAFEAIRKGLGAALPAINPAKSCRRCARPRGGSWRSRRPRCRAW